MIVTALKMARDEMGVADLKLINRSLKEMRYAAKVFARYSKFRKVVVFGSARVPPDGAESKVRRRFRASNRVPRLHGHTGGGEGIMGAAQRGAGREPQLWFEHSFAVRAQANQIIEGDPKLINFNYFFDRKLNFVERIPCVCAFPGRFLERWTRPSKSSL